MIAQGLGGGGAAEDELLLKTDVGRGGAHLDDVGARLDVPLANAALMAVEAQLLHVEAGGDGLGLSWLQGDTGEALQLDGTDLLGAVLRREIDLCNLRGSNTTRVLHLEGQLHKVVGCLCLAVHLQVLRVEGGVGETVSEGPLDLRGERSVRRQGVVAEGLIEFGVWVGDGELG